MIATLLPVIEIVTVLVAVFFFVRRMSSDLPSWWTRHVVAVDPEPELSRLDLMDRVSGATLEMK
jgi:hypothetical protein